MRTPARNCVNKNKANIRYHIFLALALTVLCGAHSICGQQSQTPSFWTFRRECRIFHSMFCVHVATLLAGTAGWLADWQAESIEFHNVIRADHYNGVNANIRNCNKITKRKCAREKSGENESSLELKIDIHFRE